jgi:monoamine oxidase
MASFHNSFLKNVAKLVQLSTRADQLRVPLDILLDLQKNRNDRVTRREILKLSLYGAAFVPASNLLGAQSWRKFTTPRARTLSPVAVLGGGIAGLVVAHRLHQMGIPVQIFEGSNRWGGRISTQRNFNSDQMFWERGGELIDSNHQDLITLAGELGLIIENTTIADNHLRPLTYSFKNEVLSEKQVLTGLQQLARAIRPELTKIAAEGATWRPSTLDAPKPYFAKLDHLSISDYLKTKEIDPWVKSLIEALYVSEYGLEADQQSSLNLLTLMTIHEDLPVLLGESDESRRIRGGNDRLPLALAEKLSKRIPMHLEHSLVKVSNSARAMKLTFLKNGTTPIEVEAEKVVCTLPFTQLREVSGVFDLELDPIKKLSIRSLGFGTCSKVGLGFRSKPWRNPNSNKIQGSTGTLLHDEHQYLWETSRLQNGTKGILTNLIGGKSGAKIEKDKVESLLKALEPAFPGSLSQFETGKVSVQHWPSHPWSRGSYTCHRPGQYTTIRGAAGKSELRGRLHFAGEHTSMEFEGFMNGAVETANQVARRIRDESIRPYPDEAHPV